MAEEIKQFDFGENWKNFSQNALTDERLEQSKQDFRKLTEGIDLVGKNFLDIGFGQGLGLLNAATLGAKITGNDINPKCAEVLKFNQQRFPNLKNENFSVVVGSILLPENVEKIRQKNQNQNFDIVHSWGVLHHTGNMRNAIENATSLVAEKGIFILAIYNRHWSSLPWLLIKWFYCHVPSFVQKGLDYVFYPIIYTAKFLVTGKNPLKKERGMNFFHDVIDWVGGYPYEYASIDEMQKMMASLGFEMLKAVPAEVPTGCNEFIFRKK